MCWLKSGMRQFSVTIMLKTLALKRLSLNIHADGKGYCSLEDKKTSEEVEVVVR